MPSRSALRPRSEFRESVPSCLMVAALTLEIHDGTAAFLQQSRKQSKRQAAWRRLGGCNPPDLGYFQGCARDDVRWLVTKDGAGEEKTAENRRGPGLNGKREGPWMADGPD